MNKIIKSLGVIVFAGALVIGGTGAFFSDTETSTGNIFTAGSVTLEVKNISHEGVNVTDEEVQFTASSTGNNLSFAFADLKPLDHGKVIYELENGANEAHVCVLVEEKENNDNGINGPEAAADDETGGDGELGQFLSFKFGSATGTLDAISGQWQKLGVVAAGATTSSTIEYGFGVFNGSNLELDPLANYNLAQTDSLTADISFYAVQTRHNPNFDCSSLNDGDEEEVGQNFGTLNTDTAYGGWANGHNGTGNAQPVDFITLDSGWNDFSVTRSVNGGGDVKFVVNTPKNLSETNDFFAVVLDYENNGVQDAQVSFYNGAFTYRVFNVSNGGDNWGANVPLPLGITATPSGVADEYTITVDSSYFTGTSYAFAVQLWLADGGYGVVNAVLPVSALNSVWHPIGSGYSSDFQVDVF